jgi:alkylated DNA nucleotide flippase Atl1
MSFNDLVYDYVRKIPRGSVCTYGEVANAIGRPGAARAVGSVMKNNPYAPYRLEGDCLIPTGIVNPVPCHRVVPASRTKSGGFFGRTDSVAVGLKTKLLLQETYKEISLTELGQLLNEQKIVKWDLNTQTFLTHDGQKLFVHARYDSQTNQLFPI